MSGKQQQQQQDAMATVRPVFHALSAAAFGYTLFYDTVLNGGATAPIPGVFFSKLVWLTLTDLCLQFVYHSVALIASFQKRSSLLARGVDFAFTSLALPIALATNAFFWGLQAIDPNLLLNDEAKRVLSVTWYNHALHTLPGVVMVLDMFITKHKRPNLYAAFGTIVAFTICYLTFLLYIHNLTGFWAYPILADLKVPARVAFIAASGLSIYALFIFGDWLNSKTWPEKNTRSAKSRAPTALLKKNKSKKI